MKKIPLTQGKYALVDDEDYGWLMEWKWHVDEGRNGNCYATRMDRDGERRISVPMHRAIMKTPKGMDTDHINHNGLDNRRRNLRICSRRQNQHNRFPNKKGTSRHKGVSWNKNSGKWVARIVTPEKHRNLGSYDCEIDAAMAYDRAATEIHKDFKGPNLPTKVSTN